MSKTYSLGLTLTSPSAGDTDWYDTADAKDTRLSSHDHSGGGMGAQIDADALAADSVNETHIRLSNTGALRGRNAANSADLNLLRATAQDLLDFSTPITYGLYSTETLTASGAVSIATARTVLNGASLAMTLAAGTTGQVKVIYNSASTIATVTPSSTSTANTVALTTGGLVVYWYHGSEWHPLLGPGATCTDDIQATTAASGTYTITGRVFTFNNAGATTATFNVGVACQRVTVHNIGAGTVTLTLTGRPAASDVLTIATKGVCELIMIDSAWQVISGDVVAITYA
jgi:hypothetical protein